ncbi:MAG: twin-arginine translocation signal domain-containing protein, partial [Gammaproteobacteria bacterium]|nr:twin-arginine translocation signal domain-containing protein [Gammaproteobacteria bacterium]
MTTRRTFLKSSAAGAAGIPLANLLAREAWATEVKITEDDPMAVALGYVHDATTADRGDNLTAD